MDKVQGRRGHAVVIGASMGGLLAARVLADRFARVTVIERDRLDGEAMRKGVPQARHAHGLLARGGAVLEELFPGLTADLLARGAVRADLQDAVLWFRGGAALAAGPSGLDGLMVSRTLLESYVRGRLRTWPGVTLRDGCAVADVIADAAARRVSGVRLDARGGPPTVAADLVVDAAGRGSHSAAWLRSLGYAAPEQEEIAVGISYTSRLYRRRADDLGGRRAVVVAAAPPDWRCAGMLAQEDDRWIVSVGGYLGDHAPTDPAGFAAFAATLRAPPLQRVVASAEPLSDPFAFNFPASLRRRYERLQRFPAGFLVFGDALCSFNPVYGQGMTTAALEALALRRCLDRDDGELAPAFFAAAAAVIDAPWAMAAGGDLAHPGVRGPRGPAMGVLNRYMAWLHRAASRDPVLARRFIEVANLTRSPAALLRPGVALRVLAGALPFGAVPGG